MPKKRFAAANLRDIKNRMSAPASGGTGIPSLRSGQALPVRTARMAVPQCAVGWRRPALDCGGLPPPSPPKPASAEGKREQASAPGLWLSESQALA